MASNLETDGKTAVTGGAAVDVEAVDSDGWMLAPATVFASRAGARIVSALGELRRQIRQRRCGAYVGDNPFSEVPPDERLEKGSVSKPRSFHPSPPRRALRD